MLRMRKIGPREEKEEDRMAEEAVEEAVEEDRMGNPEAIPEDPMMWLMEEEDRMGHQPQVDQMIDLLDLDTPKSPQSLPNPIHGPSTMDTGSGGNLPPGTEDLLGLGEASGSGIPESHVEVSNNEAVNSDQSDPSKWTQGMFPHISDPDPEA